jgi:hypothetical protein
MFQSSLSIIAEIPEGYRNTVGKTILIDQEFNTLANEIRARKIHAFARANNYFRFYSIWQECQFNLLNEGTSQDYYCDRMGWAKH